MADPPRRLAAALAGAGVILCALGWYQISGQPTVPQQLPYLASATIPGAALLIVGLMPALRGPLPPRLERLLGGPGHAGAVGAGTAAARRASAADGESLWRVPDGRYLHAADCPLLDGRTDASPVGPDEAAEAAGAGLRPCPLCRAEGGVDGNGSVGGGGGGSGGAAVPGTGSDRGR
jgi:hypothetical protein